LSRAGFAGVAAAAAAAAAEAAALPLDLTPTMFTPNAHVDGTPVRFSAFVRTSISSRRVALDDVKQARPDAIVLCCSAHSKTSLDKMLIWDRFLRVNTVKSPRIWAVLSTSSGGAPQVTLADLEKAREALTHASQKPKLCVALPAIAGAPPAEREAAEDALIGMVRECVKMGRVFRGFDRSGGVLDTIWASISGWLNYPETTSTSVVR